MRMVDAAWLEGLGACGPDLLRARDEFGPTIAVSRAVVGRARQLGINVLWAACRLAGGTMLADFVAFTLQQRKAGLDALLGRAAPQTTDALRALAAAEHGRWAETGEIAARSLAVALREAARDTALSEPTPEEAEEAALAARRAISYAGLDELAAAEEQLEWFAARLITE